jgi:thiamine pyrophosphate-dependent acetolactate synthase large subunit-like protein
VRDCTKWDDTPWSLSHFAESAVRAYKTRNEDWSLVSTYYSDGGGWPRRLWKFDKSYQWIGNAGGGGIGYGAPASVGAALANRKHGRLSVSIQADGDLMYAPGVLWTAAHHRIPLLSVMHNNRSYHQEPSREPLANCTRRGSSLSSLRAEPVDSSSQKARASDQPRSWPHEPTGPVAPGALEPPPTCEAKA